MTIQTVTTFQELQNAKENGVDQIIVEGKLAQDLIDARKIATLSASSIAALTGAIAVASTSLLATPITGGISAIAAPISIAVATPIAIASGLSVPTIIFLVSLGVGGLTVLIALYKEYTIEIDCKQGKIIFTK